MSKEERCTRRKLHRNFGQIFEKSAISQITRRTWMGRSWVYSKGKLTQEQYTYKLTKSECLRYSLNWSPQLNSSGSNAPMTTRPDYRAAVVLKNHLYRYSEVYLKPISPQDQDRVREDTKFSETYRQEARVDKKTGWKFWTSSSSSSWRQIDELDWKEYESSLCRFDFNCFLFCHR